MDDATSRNATYLSDTRHTLGLIDQAYTTLGTLGIGAFGTVFLAQKRSGRKVALKVMPMDTSDDEDYTTFLRELESVTELNTAGDDNNSGSGKNRDQHIVFFEDWFISRNFVCIVMQYADGGTLRQEIERRGGCCPVEPYAERRIAWYALQLCDALAFAHEKGVAHHDVKSSNILIDASAGGKLLLADFGTALKPGEETVGFTKSYASPELLASHELEDFSDLRPDSIDAFALGAVIYEMLTLKRLEDLSADQTLAQFITDGPGLQAAMTIDHMVLPWLPPKNTNNNAPYVGYTHELKSLVMCFLQPNVQERFLPGQMQQNLRHDPLSPLLLPHVAAAQTARAGDAVTIDNLQLGLFVQRGRDWTDGDDDGGINSIGVIVKLDGDGTYADVAFPIRSSNTKIESLCCRIGANNKFELQVGPSALHDYVSGNGLRTDGILHVGTEVSNMSVGQMLNSNCMVVGMNKSLGIVFVAPMERTHTPPLPKKAIWGSSSSFVLPSEEIHPPSTWQLELGPLVNVLNTEEGADVLELFYDNSGGLKQRNCPVKSIQRVQENWLWESYSQRKQTISNENWGIENEIRAFLVNPDELHGTNLHSFQSSGRQFSTKSSVIHYKFNKRAGRTSTTSQMLLCRIAVGRVQDESGKVATTRHTAPITATCHSEALGKDIFACRVACMVYPEYIITYDDNTAAPTTNNNLDNSPNKQGGRSESKMCIICLERPVRYIMIPCGHPCLCEKCNGSQIKRKLRGKCPECRARFQSTTIIYGRVVNDD